MAHDGSDARLNLRAELGRPERAKRFGNEDKLVKPVEGLTTFAGLCPRRVSPYPPMYPRDPLDPLLDHWSDTPDPSPRLASEVWRRIALTESAAVKRNRWNTVDGWFSRAPFAALFVTSCALLGLFLAEIRLSHEQRKHNTQLARSYLQLIDPRLTTEQVARHP